MNRSPLAYPLTRGIDGDSGGAADLQTDIMRFMAILGLCLVAIFSLVQSLPTEVQVQEVQSNAEPQAVVMVEPTLEVPREPETYAKAAQNIRLTRPTWVSTFTPAKQAKPERLVEPQPQASGPPVDPVEEEGFTLRFQSDHALTRLVATGQVGFYAINDSRTQRMTVSDSRISFWDASTPKRFHEMDASTVPRAVLAALARTGANAGATNWGVTLPGNLSAQLTSLMQQHTGGALVIQADGQLQLEPRS